MNLKLNIRAPLSTFDNAKKRLYRSKQCIFLIMQETHNKSMITWSGELDNPGMPSWSILIPRLSKEISLGFK